MRNDIRAAMKHMFSEAERKGQGEIQTGRKTLRNAKASVALSDGQLRAVGRRLSGRKGSSLSALLICTRGVHSQ